MVNLKRDHYSQFDQILFLVYLGNMVDVSKKEIKELLFEQTTVILNAVDEKLNIFKADINTKFEKMDGRLNKIEEAIRELTLTLDEFMKRVINQDEEIVLLRAKVDKITAFIKEKFGVEISAQ